MAERYQLPDGRIAEKTPDGKYRIVSSSAPSSISLGGPDPTLPSKITRERNEAAASNSAPEKAAAEARIAQLEAQIKAIEANNAGATSQADLEKARLEVQKLQAEIAQLQTGKGSALTALQQQVDRVSDLYRQQLHGGLPNVVNDVIPDFMQPDIGAFNSASQGLYSPFMSAFRVPGSGSQSDTELRQFIQANTPEPGDSDAVIEEKLRTIQTRIDAERGTKGQAAQPSAPPASAAPTGEDVSLAGGKTRSEINPALKATAQRLGSMVAQGVPDDQIIKFMQDSRINPANTNINEILRARKTPQFKQWQRQNPGKAYPIGPSLYTKEVPMSAAQVIGNQAAQSAPGAFIAAAANGVTGGYLDNMTDSPEMARTGMQLLRQQHPLASFAGDVAGYATDEALLARIPGAQALMARRFGSLGRDALYGGFSGSGENDDNRLTGALTGAVTNTAGGMFGRGLQRKVGGALTGVRNPNLDYLNNAGVPLTVGQIGNGSDSITGKVVGGIEDRLAGLPIADAIINSARRRGEQGFNSAAFKGAGGSGLTGSRGVEELHNNVNNAYSFLDPVTLPLDAQFAGTNAAVRSSLPALPKYGPEIGASLNTIDKASANGALSGRDWQQALRTIKGDKASLSGKEFSTGAIDTMDDVENNLLGLASRQSPANLQVDLGKANALNKQFRTITSALDNGPTQARGELFSPSRLDAASRASQRKFGGQVSSMEGNRPFYDLTKAGLDVMPNQVPDSGTAGRSLLYAALPGILGGSAGALYGGAVDDNGSAGHGAAIGSGYGTTLLPAAILATLYSKGGQKMLQKALVGERPRIIDVLGESLKRNPRLAGMFGASAARDYVYQPELPPQ